jgi:hypothetical protein
MAARAAARVRSGEEKLEIAARTHSGDFRDQEILEACKSRCTHVALAHGVSHRQSLILHVAARG